MYIAENGQYAKLYIEESAYSGVKKIASKVAEDLKKVTDHEFTVEYGLPKDTDKINAIVIATLGKDRKSVV